MYLIDTHCHLHDREFFNEEQAEKMLETARARGVKQIICIGTNEEDSEKAYNFAKENNLQVFILGGLVDCPELTSEVKSEPPVTTG